MQIARDLCSKINSRYKEIPSSLHAHRDATQTAFRFRWLHVTEEVVSNHDILRSKHAYQPRITCIVQKPANFFTNPRSDSCLIPIALKHFFKLCFCHPLEY